MPDLITPQALAELEALIAQPKPEYSPVGVVLVPRAYLHSLAATIRSLMTERDEALKLAYMHDPFDPTKRGEPFKALWETACEMRNEDVAEAHADLAKAQARIAELRAQKEGGR